ncbi:hypothetical protein ACHAPF_007419 [Botrytis cinerea]|uniref:Uncharacterized protein n=1 Tax=Botryotinia fuckeliana (strain T4) TaxID=999810 RepID=G2Y0G5_BOTF4|nr:hypothetical protein BofuT4_P116800.1 [Botrytis cinerea T4]
MAARRTPGPSVGSLCSTFLAPVSTEQSIPKVYVDFEKEYRQLVIRNTELSDANRKFKCNMSNHRRAYEATPFSSSGSSVVLIGLASPTSSNVPSSSARDKLQEVTSLLPASDEPLMSHFSNNFQASRKIWELK